LAASLFWNASATPGCFGIYPSLKEAQENPNPIHHIFSGESVAGTLSVTGPSSTWKTSCSICFRILVYEDASMEALNYLNHGVFIIWNTTAPGAFGNW
jgi:hypothetical protein